MQGRFGRGHTIRILAPDGTELARGLTRYASADLLKLAGQHSSAAEGLLGYTYGPEAVHRDDLVRL